MSFQIDSKRWDLYHQKTQDESFSPSIYAREREIIFPRNSLIVDLGGGIGADAIYFLEKGHSVVLLDISEFALKRAIKRAREKGLDKKLAIKQVDFSLHAIPVKPESTDIAYSRLTLNYFDMHETTVLLREIFSLLKNGGSAYLTFKSPDDVEELTYLRKRAVEIDENVFIDNGQIRSRFSLSQLEKIAKDAGLLHFEVRPYVEDLGTKVGESLRKLYTNELYFSKT